MRRVLYVDTYTAPATGGAAPSSDSIGYGVTASRVIQAGLCDAGFDVVRPTSPHAVPGAGRRSRLDWLTATYAGVVDVLAEAPPDVVFTFHAFATFPVELRRMLLDLRLDVPIVGYTHGSHWDPSDSYRVETYPGLEMADLANLATLDRLLVVSDYLRHTLRRTIGDFNKELAAAIDARTAVVGLPLDTGRIDAARTDERFDRPTVVFNHAPVSSKNPELFVRVMQRVLPHSDAAVVFTRAFPPGTAGADAVAELAAGYPDRVVLGRDMPLDDYYRTLWRADLQVSTASHESLGVSTLEAMYAETCCLLPRLGSYPEITDSHPDALYEPGADALERRLFALLADVARRRSVARDLRQLARRYEPGVVVRRIIDVINDVSRERR